MDILLLPKTQLSLDGDKFKKFGRDNALLATFPLERVSGIRCEKYKEYGFPTLLVLTSLALGIVAKIYIPSPGWGWAFAVLCSAVAFMAFATLEGRKIILETDAGTVTYIVADTPEEAEGFVVSAQQRLSELCDE